MALLHQIRTKYRAIIYHPDRVKKLAYIVGDFFLLSLPRQWRKSLFWGEAHYCPICNSHVRCFLVLGWTTSLVCPICRSLHRHRMGWLYLTRNHLQKHQLPKKFLHIGPEPALQSVLKGIPGLEYLTADLEDPRAMVKMDITDIQFPDDSFDLIYCSHVLEHVEDDRQAIKEITRVLKPSGEAILMVPITAGEKTIEDPSITDPFERQRIFGQYNHVRLYGMDFPERLRSCGLEVSIITPDQLVDPGDIIRFGIRPDERIFLGRK